MDISKLVKDLNLELQTKKNSFFSEQIYRDEPILRVASSFASSEPKEYRLMRKLGVTFDRTFYTESRIFYEQAKFMENFEDQFDENAPFTSFFPTYRVMSIRQQRTYFSWRTKIRHGSILPIDLSYVFVYLYELIHLIGVRDADDAYKTISAFVEDYAAFDPMPKRFAEVWLHDLVVYYGLSPRLLVGNAKNKIAVSAQTLAHPEAYTDEQLFQAICNISTYTVENSRFYKKNATDFVAVSTAVYREMTAFFEKNRKSAFCDAMLGKCKKTPYEMFSSAVFFDFRRAEARTFAFHEMDRYICESGRWYHCRPAGGISKSKQLGAFLRNIDAVMREAYGFPFELKRQEPTRQLEQAILTQVAVLKEKKSAAERRVVTIDFSVLERIRAASEATREKILTQDERADDMSFAPAARPQKEQEDAIAARDPVPSSAENDFPALTPTEESLLSCLLAGVDPAPVLKQQGILVSVAADSLNERLFDFFADNVIEFSGDTPSIVEDYRAALQSYLS